MPQKGKLPHTLIESTPWDSGSNAIWPATSFTLHRNIVRHPFPQKLSTIEQQRILSNLTDILLQSPALKHPSFFKAETLDTNDKDFLYEHFLCMDGFQNSLIGQGFIVDDTGHFLGLINIEDHLQIQLIDSQGSWETAWNTLNQIETVLGSSIEFAYSPYFGYLTADPTLCGTGLIIQAYLHLPALIRTGQLQETLQKQQEEGVKITGMGGSSLEDTVGDLLVVRNSYTLGISEDTLLHDTQVMAMKLMALEKTLRSHIKKDNSLDIQDQISRAYGLMVHSYQLQTKEALNALSLIKLGLDLDWIEGMTDSALNTLFFKCRRAHLSEILGKHLTDTQEIARKRAEFIHKHMQVIQLKIHQ